MKTIKQRMAVGRSLLLLLFALTLPTHLWAEGDDLSGTYYLYNVDDATFMYNDGNNPPRLGAAWTNTYNRRYNLQKQTDGSYFIRPVNNGWYISTWNNNADLWNSSSTNSSYKRNFTITSLPDGNYTLTNTYWPSNFVGKQNNTDYPLSAKMTDECITWKLLNTDSVSDMRFVLGKALATVDSTLYADYHALMENDTVKAAELQTAINSLTQILAYQKTDAPIASWNEVPMTCWTGYTWNRSTSDNVAFYYSWCSSSRNTSGNSYLYARVNIKEASKIIFETYADGSNSTQLQFFVDGVELKYLESRAMYDYFRYRGGEAREEEGTSSMYDGHSYNRYFIDLTEGLHTLEWKYINSSKNGDYFYLRNIGVIKNPTTISINCVEPGSLGNEVLYQVDNVNDVRRLKIKGTINDDDWARIKMMTRLVALDLSETTITSLPDKKFDNYSSSNQWPFLHELKLPKNLETIGKYCFRFSYIEHIDIPGTVKSIGEYAFYRSQIHELNIDTLCTSIGNGAFSRCYFLKNVTYNPNMTYVPAYCFHHSNYIQPFELPSKITQVRSHAFQSLWSFDCTLPEDLTTVEANGFSYCHALSSKLPKNLQSIGVEGFDHCYKLQSPLPEGIKTIGNYAFRTTRWAELMIPESVTSIGEYNQEIEGVTNVEIIPVSA